MDFAVSCDAAEALRGELLECPDDELQRADPDAFFVHELIGLRVETVDGRELGRLVEVLVKVWVAVCVLVTVFVGD